MAAEPGSTANGSWERPTAFYSKNVKYGIYALILLFFAYSFWNLRMSPARFIQGLGAGVELISSMLPPAYTPTQRELLIQGIIESIVMAIVATVIGIIISIPVAVMASDNLVPGPIYYIGRSIVATTRSLHELIVAIVMVKAVGFGPLAGVLALAFKTIGFFAKLLAEEIEDIDHGQMEAVTAVGGNSIQRYLYGVLPQVMPRIVGLSIYRLDINLRHSTVVGIVGAGGIGITLLNSFDKYDYQFSMAIISVIVVIVMIGEGISAVARRRIQ
ncbi:phosphonate ABC transporter, permease protein PhnE [Halohasta litorea]|uniref:Phosphonate ABC transporter, permease protein PhnE n=1 Tax=Halohasta litorea TaxID=869891 RepID=A0ABD6D6W2_9EURY|nr:phosphonate ABC transporter, permease protein PhnE [Halohasta litorea]